MLLFEIFSGLMLQLIKINSAILRKLAINLFAFLLAVKN